MFHDVYTEELNKVALNPYNDKRLITFDGIHTHPYSVSVFKLFEPQMLTKLKDKAIPMYY